jgi:hypothetical protein
MLAQNLAYTLLAYFVEDGGRLLDAQGGRPVDVKTLFQKGVSLPAQQRIEDAREDKGNKGAESGYPPG